METAKADAKKNLGRMLGATTRIGTGATAGVLEIAADATDTGIKFGKSTVGLVGDAGEAATEITGVAITTATGAAKDAGEIARAATGTAASAITGTAAAVTSSVAQLNKVISAKGKEITERQVALDNARLAALKDPKNITLQTDVETESRKLVMKRAAFNNERLELLQQTKAEMDALSDASLAVVQRTQSQGKLVAATAAAAIADANFEKAIHKGNAYAELIRLKIAQDQMLSQQEKECKEVLRDLKVEELADTEVQLPASVEDQNKFCSAKTMCERTGKHVGAFGLAWKNPDRCKELTQRYARLKNLRSPRTSSGGRKNKTLKRKSKKRRYSKKQQKRPRKQQKRSRKQQKRPRKLRKRTRRYRKR